MNRTYTKDPKRKPWLSLLLPLLLAATALPAASQPSSLQILLPRVRNQLGMEFILVAAGPGRLDAWRKQDAGGDQYVWQSRPYYLQTTEVTQAQWQAVTRVSQAEICARRPVCGPNPQLGPQLPVHSLSHSEIQAFIRLLSADGQTYRLPSRAQWERAALAGQWRARWWWGDDPGQLPRRENCLAAGEQRPWLPWLPRDGYTGLAPVASFAPNPWGFYDMYGNVSELLADATLRWRGSRQDPARHFASDPSGYLRAYTDFPPQFADYPYRDGAGGNYRLESASCGVDAGHGLVLDGPTAAEHSGEIASATVGFRLLRDID